MKYMTAEDWAEFNRRFPSAEAFINARSLKREYECLKDEKERLLHYQSRWLAKFPTHTQFPDRDRLVWVLGRVKELDEHFAAPTVS